MRTKSWIHRLLPGPVRGPALRKRYDVLNYFAARRGYLTYLEIGTATGRCLQRVDVPSRTGVDPRPKSFPPLLSPRESVSSPAWKLRTMTSDQFFAENQSDFDMIFIDGLHLAEQVLNDVYNSLNALRPGGAILLHDCSPSSEKAQLREVPDSTGGGGHHWNGDTWKAIVFLRKNHPELFTRVLDLDYGIGVVIPRDYDNPPAVDASVEAAEAFFGNLTYQDLERNRTAMLGLLPHRAALEKELLKEGIWAA